jgi:hypothetical protein
MKHRKALAKRMKSTAADMLAISDDLQEYNAMRAHLLQQDAIRLKEYAEDLIIEGEK